MDWSTSTQATFVKLYTYNEMMLIMNWELRLTSTLMHPGVMNICCIFYSRKQYAQPNFMKIGHYIYVSKFHENLLYFLLKKAVFPPNQVSWKLVNTSTYPSFMNTDCTFYWKWQYMHNRISWKLVNTPTYPSFMKIGCTFYSRRQYFHTTKFHENWSIHLCIQVSWKWVVV